MSEPSAMAELPKSLQSLIQDAKAAVDRGDCDDDDAADSSVLQSVNDWTRRLSCGEFEEHLYWECVAEDCEESGDWEGAKAAYTKILDRHDLDSHHWKAYSLLAYLHGLLGENDAALASYAAAVSNAQAQRSVILWRLSLTNEAQLMLHTGRIRAARKLIKRGLASFDSEHADYLGNAKLLILAASCDLASNKLSAAERALQQAWQFLEVNRETLEAEDSMQDALGVHAAYGRWWRVEAKRRWLAGEGDREIEALGNACERARYCVSSWPRHDHDLTLMHTLQMLEDAFDRHSKSDKAAIFRAEANAIRIRRHFPENANGLLQPFAPPRFSRFAQISDFCTRLFRKQK